MKKKLTDIEKLALHCVYRDIYTPTGHRRKCYLKFGSDKKLVQFIKDHPEWEYITGGEKRLNYLRDNKIDEIADTHKKLWRRFFKYDYIFE